MPAPPDVVCHVYIIEPNSFYSFEFYNDERPDVHIVSHIDKHESFVTDRETFTNYIKNHKKRVIVCGKHLDEIPLPESIRDLVDSQCISNITN